VASLRTVGLFIIVIANIVLVSIGISSGYYIRIQEAKIRDLEAQVNEWTTNYTKLTNEYQALLNEYNILSANYSALQSDYSRLSAEHGELLNKYASLSEAYSALSADYATLQGEYATLRASYDSLQNAYQSLSSRYDALSANYTALEKSYSTLKSNYDALSNKYTQLITWYNSLAEEVNSRVAPQLITASRYITPDDPDVISTMINVTGGWSNPSDWNEFWNDVYRLYKWVESNIVYSYDSPEPVLPSIGGKLTWREDFWRFPNETLRDRTGDCEDMANLLASLILAYSGKTVNVWVMLVYFDDGGHAVVVIPVQGGRIAIVDPPGHYYTSSNGAITAKDVATELENYLNYWASGGHTNGRVYAIYSYNIQKVFNSNQDFINYVRSVT